MKIVSRSVLYYYYNTIVTHMQFSGLFGCTQWLMGTKDGCAVVGHAVAHFLSGYLCFLSFLLKNLFLINIYMLINVSP